jgi:hypothetical protein
MTNPHLLGEEFARRYGGSQTSSPDAGFAELMEESDGGEGDSANVMAGPTPDIMIASLNSIRHNTTNQGQAIGPLEAFYPTNWLVEDEDVFSDPRGDDLGEDVININDVIHFNNDSDDSDTIASPISTPHGQSFFGNDFAHLNSGNVTAFRRNADPSFEYRRNDDPASRAMKQLPAHLDVNLASSPLATPRPSKQRIRAHSSPYTSSHYKGVTPVQRRRDPNNGRVPEFATPAKKRKLTT